MKNLCHIYLGLFFIIVLALSGCATFDARTHALNLVHKASLNFFPVRIETSHFILQGWMRYGVGNVLHIYIEGDGHAWKNSRTPSDDPTPHNPVGLKLALADTTQNPVLYLARPCQYTIESDRKQCEMQYWTSARYSEQVITSLDESINYILDKLNYGQETPSITKIALYGFSGGGALAALLAERRHDIAFLATVAANLDTSAWIKYHRASPMPQSINPATYKKRINTIPQIHLNSKKDRICPPFLAEQWCNGLQNCSSITIDNVKHGGDWEQHWLKALKLYRPQF